MMRQCKGYLTIYVSLCMCVMISLCLVLIEGARRSTIRVEGELITDIAMESVFAEYHRELFKQYNLVYVDSSYGSVMPSYQNVGNRLKYYLKKNTDYGEELGLGFLYRDFLKMEFQDIQVEEVCLATDNNGYGFARQAVEAVKDDIGITYLEEVWKLIQKVEEQELLGNDWEEKRKRWMLRYSHMMARRYSSRKRNGPLWMWLAPRRLWITCRQKGFCGG